LVVGKSFQPVHLLQVKFLATFVLTEYLKEMLSFSSTQDLGFFREVRYKDKHQNRHQDGDEALDDEDPSEALESRDTIHVANTIG
ncbi:hypothetical protein SLS61_002012, partial [Didymella pomorum]